MRAFRVCVFAMGLLAACGSSAHEEQHDEHEEDDGRVAISAEAMSLAGIEVGRAEQRALSLGASIPAEIELEPSSTAHVGSLVAGRFTKVAVGIGDRVTRGQLLAVVASSDVAAARAQLGQSRARLEAARADRDRQAQLSAEGIGSARSLIESEANVGALEAEVTGVQRQLEVFGSGRSGELSLKAPIDGVVVAVHATLGEAASPDAAAFVVTDPTKVWVRGNVPELEIARVVSGAGVRVRLHAFPGLAMPGHVTYVAPALEESTRSLPIRVTLAALDPRLKSGLYGNIELLGDHEVLAVPADAVATIDGQNVVFIAVGEGAFERRPVELGRRADGYVEIRSGLKADERIALHGAFTLKSVLERGSIQGHAH